MNNYNLTGVEWVHHSHHYIMGENMQGFDILLLVLILVGCLVMYILWKVGVIE